VGSGGDRPASGRRAERSGKKDPTRGVHQPAKEKRRGGRSSTDRRGLHVSERRREKGGGATAPTGGAGASVRERGGEGASGPGKEEWAESWVGGPTRI